MNSTAFLSVVDISAGYGAEVIRGISFDADPGDMLAFMGRSGSGKSTLLKAISGQIPITGGSIRYPPRGSAEVAVLYQTPYAFPWHSVLRNLQEATGLGQDDALAALALVELEGAAAKYPFELSGGMLRRLGMLMALWGQQPIVLLDEPFAGMDDWTRLLAFRALEMAAKEAGKIVLITTHSAEEAIALADRVYAIAGAPASIVMNVPVALERPRYGRAATEAALSQATSGLRSSFALRAI